MKLSVAFRCLFASLSFFLFVSCVLCPCAFCATGATGADEEPNEKFAGWETMRVIEQQGRPTIIRHADIDGDGREELIIVNRRQSRLDIYEWMPADKREVDTDVPSESVNDLPMAAEFKHREIHLENLPVDVVVSDIDGDGQAELIVLVTASNKVVVYKQSKDNKWEASESFDLLPGDYAPRHRPMLLRTQKKKNASPELLIGFSDGVQQLSLTPKSRADWLAPREREGRLDWWLADFDGDGDDDLIEQSRNAKQSIRWFEATASGTLQPARVLFDRAVIDAMLLSRGEEPARLLLLDSASRGLLRTYDLKQSESSPLGRQCPLGIPGGRKAVWCGVKLGDTSALVVADPDRPRLLVYSRDAEGWKFLHDYPAISNIVAIAAPIAEPGTLLLRQKESNQLQVTRWKDNRLTYPTQLEPKVEGKKLSILAMDTVGETVWWVQKVDDTLHLFTWSADQSEPQDTVFDKIGTRAKEATWLGGTKLFFKELHARTAKLAVVNDGKTTVTEPAHIKKLSPNEFLLLSNCETQSSKSEKPTSPESARVARLTEGSLQWLDDDLRPIDQIMLPEDRKLKGYIADGKSHGWAIQDDGKFIHRLEINESGIAKIEWSRKIPESESLVCDPILGLILIDRHRITSLEEGQAFELDLVSLIDDRIARSHGIRKTSIHRIGNADLDGDGSAEVLLFDDLKHRITALHDVNGSLEPLTTWPIFEDKKYPYGDDSEPTSREPRVVLCADFDGDGANDLAMLCHDRLVIYLKNKE